jgi:hypothetical protein
VTKRAKIIIGVLIALLVGSGVIAAFSAASGITPKKSSNQIKAEIEQAFKGKDYFSKVDVKSYKGFSQEEDGDKVADSAAITITLSKIDETSFKEAASLLPKLEMTAFYSIGDTANVEHITSVTGFKYSDFKDEATVNAIADSLKVQDTYKGSYWQISRGNAEGTDQDKLKTQYVAKSDKVADIRKTVNAVLSSKMDVLPVAKTTLSQGSFVQFAAVEGKMENFDKGLELGLKFADKTFLGGEKIALLGLGDDIQVSYTSLRKDLNNDKLTAIAKELNKEQLFKIKVVDPNAVSEEAPETAKPTATSTATSTPTPSSK